VRDESCRLRPPGVLELEDRVNLVGADGNIVSGPAENLGIEGFGGGLIRRDELDPAEVAGRMFFDVWHGWRLLFVVVGSKRDRGTCR